MTEVLFYHLQNAPLERALSQLLEASLKREWRAVVKSGRAERVEELNNHLWTYQRDSFLPHGTAEDGSPDVHPVYLTVEDENPNGAHVLFLVHGATSGRIGDFNRCVLMFDGGDEEALGLARSQWKELKSAGHDATYWQQNDEGRWEKKA